MAEQPNTRERQCPQCGSVFQYKTGRGVDRKYCGRPCAASAAMVAFQARHGHRRCEVEGCTNKVKNTRMGLCARHEARMRRGGSLALRRAPINRRVDKRGYVMVKAPDHLFADYAGWCYEHRLVAYEASGAAEPRCYWCDRAAPWHVNVIDHLNEDKGDNAPSNLVVACNGCNRARGAIIPFVRGLDDTKLAAFIETLHLMRKCNAAKGDKEYGQLRLLAA